ncbi:DUF6455 family protein [Phaeovulum veldkampii]|nr:DUF6455 family protein [Phaeovulum veldkampii]TDQ58211.1 hypothetical protein EV658_11065 [Phaeovulum veldkampii DSM 11550]
MGIQGNIDLHFWMTRGMARRLGVNLTAAMQDGLLTQGDLAEMVLRCHNCSGAKGCLAFLAEYPDRAEAAPDWCSNAQVLRELSALN